MGELLSRRRCRPDFSLECPEVKAKPKMPADWYTAYLESLKIGRAGLPEIVDVTQYRDIFGVAIQKAIEGGNAAELSPRPARSSRRCWTRPRSRAR